MVLADTNKMSSGEMGKKKFISASIEIEGGTHDGILEQVPSSAQVVAAELMVKLSCRCQFVWWKRREEDLGYLIAALVLF